MHIRKNVKDTMIKHRLATQETDSMQALRPPEVLDLQIKSLA